MAEYTPQFVRFIKDPEPVWVLSNEDGKLWARPDGSAFQFDSESDAAAFANTN